MQWNLFFTKRYCSNKEPVVPATSIVPVESKLDVIIPPLNASTPTAIA
jgi:hypothetical protein